MVRLCWKAAAIMLATSWAVSGCCWAMLVEAVGVATLAGEEGIESRRGPSCCRGEGEMLLGGTNTHFACHSDQSICLTTPLSGISQRLRSLFHLRSGKRGMRPSVGGAILAVG